jgi:hypothetical protein
MDERLNEIRTKTPAEGASLACAYFEACMDIEYLLTKIDELEEELKQKSLEEQISFTEEGTSIAGSADLSQGLFLRKNLEELGKEQNNG